ncbi:helix-turn-helix transcriptional regulator [Microbispora sp. GKU 823]|uniref:helix-turn-helix domain-containing protein n=1 Tax=Microbispora sp. GKU 823 TaxID=1652100 RepID=UPI00117D278C|nr:helix-turn-helix transcriptional regulator [Microbispora sp. GKU 823]
MVKTRSWPADRFRALLDDVMRQTQLSQAQLAAYVPIDQSQLSRWRSGASRPRYESLATLGRALQREHPELGIGPDEILAAAGYTTDPEGPPGREEDAAEARAAAPSRPASEVTRTVEEIQAEINEILARMTPEERAQWERDMAAEDARLELIRQRRRLQWARLMRGESPELD